MKKISFLIITFLIFFLFACNNSDNEVIVYTTVDRIFSEPILKDFEKETGIKVKAVYDTEETKSAGILNRIIAEKDNPQCDVFWSGDPARTEIIKYKGITEAYESVNAKGINPVFKDPENHWTGFSARARVLIYNKKMLPDSLVPSSIFDLTGERLRGNVAVANPLFGTTTFHFAALFSVLGDEKAKKFLEDLKHNDIVIAASNGDVKKRVINGEIACGLTDTDDAFEAMKETEDAGMVFLDQNGIGTLIMPNTVSLIKNSGHQENGKKLADYLLSKETERKLANSCAQMPLHKGVETPKGIPSADSIVPLKINYGKTARKMEEIRDYLKSWLENNEN
ncbi:MAG: extracellular solute-binding protein [Chlorobi bacterium]|nr:extracellular solute-binding protein [Chlorobiota bacterium]